MKGIMQIVVAVVLLAIITGYLHTDGYLYSQSKSGQTGIFEYKLLPNWTLDKEFSNDEFLTFRHNINGELRYIVRLRHKGTITRHIRDFETHIGSIKKSHQDRKDFIDHIEYESRYKTLGKDKCYMMSYIAPAFNHRGFIFTPVVDGVMYQVFVFDKVDKKKELRKEAADFIAGITIAGTKKEDIKTPVESKGAYRSLEVQGELTPAAKPIPFLDINKITASQWDGAIAAAMEGMRLVYGPMNESQDAKFVEAWSPLRQTPFKEAVDYMNKFNPLLGEFLVYRAAVVQTSQLLEEAVQSAGFAAEFDDPEGVRAYMDLASKYRNLLISREKRLEQVIKALTDLGNPPDGNVLMAQRQGQYKKAKEFLNSLVSTFAPEGCWAGTQNQFFDPSYKLGEVYYPRYFYVYKIDTPDGEKYYNIELCAECNYNNLPGKTTVTGGMGDKFIRRELLAPEYVGRGVGGANDGKIFNYFLKFNYPQIPSFPETSDSRMKQLTDLDKKQNNNFSIWESSFTKAITKNRMADAFFKTAIKWSEEERWDDYAHDPDNIFIPDELKKSFAAEMSGGVASAGTVKKSPVQTSAKPAASGLHLVDDKSAEERKKLDEEAIQFHINNLAIIDKNMVRNRADLAKERDPIKRESLRLRILGAQADQQAEKDRIATIQTGKTVHSRSAWDDYAKSSFIQNIAQNQQKMENISRSIRKAYEAADRLPDDKAREAREIINSKFKGEMVGNLDEAGARAVIEQANAVGKKHYEEIIAKAKADNKEAVDEAEWAESCLQTAQVVKTTADYTMMGLSLFGGQYVNNMYQGVTGYIEGGPKEAFLRVAGSYNTAAGLAVDGFRGFEQAVNEGGDFIDGIKGAGWEAAKGYITDKALNFGMGKLSSAFSRPNGEFPEIDGPNSKRATQVQSPEPVRPKAKPAKDLDDFNRPLSQQEMAVYREQVADGRNRVNSYKKTYEKLEQARKAGAPPTEIKKILVELDDRSAKIHGSPQAKMMMKTMQKNPKNLDLIKRYSNSMDRVHTRVEKRFQQDMDGRGWSKEELEPIRNRPDPADLQRAREKQARGETVQPEELLGSKTVNMDYDAGRKAKIGPDGKPVPPKKNGENVSVEAWHSDAQDAWERAYFAETGQSPKHSWENITHSKVGDAYADLNVLQKNGILHANKAWAGQTSDVTYYKAEHMKGSPEFQRVEKYVEIARGTSKDYKTKMNPLFEKKRPKPGTPSHEAWQKHKDYWDKVNNVMDQMGSGRKDPLSADREIREITGGKSFLEVTFDMRNFMESLIVL
jgi:hypothetical protein